MEKMQKRSKPVTLLISLLGSWIVTAVLLVLLAAAMMKFQLEEGKISAAVTVIYLGSAFLGGRIAGRRTENKKYLWGLLAGMSVHGRRNVRRNACFLKAFRVKVHIDF